MTHGAAARAGVGVLLGCRSSTGGSWAGWQLRVGGRWSSSPFGWRLIGWNLVAMSREPSTVLRRPIPVRALERSPVRLGEHFEGLWRSW